MQPKIYCLWMQTIFVFASFVWFAEALQRNCLYLMGQCVEHCPVNMHPYHTRCDIDTLSQRTCAFPEVYVLGMTCGWSRCDCNSDLVLSDHEGCIPLTDCKVTNFRGPKDKRRRRKGKRFRVKNLDDDEMHKGLEPVHMIGEMPAFDTFDAPKYGVIN